MCPYFLFTEMPDRNGSLSLPISKSKEEHHRLMNGNSAETVDWVSILPSVDSVVELDFDFW